MVQGWQPQRGHVYTIEAHLGGSWGETSTIVPPPPPIVVYGQKVNLRVTEGLTVGLTVWVEYRLR